MASSPTLVAPPSELPLILMAKAVASGRPAHQEQIESAKLRYSACDLLLVNIYG